MFEAAEKADPAELPEVLNVQSDWQSLDREPTTSISRRSGLNQPLLFAALVMLLAETVRQIHGAGTLVAPYLTSAAVDARWYAVHSRHVYRFRGVQWEADATQRIHGVDERIAVDAYLDGIRFMYRLIQNANHLE